MANMAGGGRRAVVAGAGIGGLTAAAALGRRGWDVTVLERARALEPVGAGLGLAPNALHALDAIGLGAGVRRLSAVQGQGGLRRPDGRWLVRTDLNAIAARFGDPQLMALRADLVGLLAASLPAGALRTGVTVTSVDAGAPGRRPASSPAPATWTPTWSSRRTASARSSARRCSPITPARDTRASRRGVSSRPGRPARWSPPRHGGQAPCSAPSRWPPAASTATPARPRRPARATTTRPPS